MAILTAGIDDTATATQKSEGWGFVILPQESAAELQQAAVLLSKTPFHANKSDKRNINKYEQFLKAVKEAVIKRRPSLLVHIFDDRSWHADLKQIARTAVNGGNVQLDPGVDAAITYVLAPLLSLQRVTAGRNLANDLLEVWLDESGVTQGFSAMRAGTVPPIAAAAFVKAVYNGCRKLKFPDAPNMAVDGFHVVPDEQSILIQAADVFGNFAAAYAAWKLGATDVRRLRGEAFGRVFQSPDIADILSRLSLQGNYLEVSLADPGALKLVIS